MKQRMLWVATVLALAGAVAHAQETTSLQGGASGAQDQASVALRISQLQAQLEAVERETLRRLDCQANSQVSTDTGCQEIPGLREYVESHAP